MSFASYLLHDGGTSMSCSAPHDDDGDVELAKAKAGRMKRDRRELPQKRERTNPFLAQRGGPLAHQLARVGEVLSAEEKPLEELRPARPEKG
jgi:hypothetical protein